MAKTGGYTRLYWHWREGPRFARMSEQAQQIWPDVLANRWMNGLGLYEMSVEQLARVSRCSPEEAENALGEMAREKLIVWDAETDCIFLVNYMRYNYDSLKPGDNRIRSALKFAPNVAHLSLYPLLPKCYPSLAGHFPGAFEAPRNGVAGRDTQLPVFVPGEMPEGAGGGIEGAPLRQAQDSALRQAQDSALRQAQDSAATAKAPPAVGKEEGRYLALRKRCSAEILAVYDVLAKLFEEHSRQPRSPKDWRGKSADLSAVRLFAQKTRDLVGLLPAAFTACFAEDWEELEYYRTGKGRFETVTGLMTVWRDGTLKGVALVNAYASAAENRGVQLKMQNSKGKIEEMRKRLDMAEREVQVLAAQEPVNQAELAKARSRVEEIKQEIAVRES